MFLKAQPLGKLLQWALGKWLSCDCHQVVSLPPLLQVLALAWAQFDLLLFLLAKAGCRVTKILDSGSPENFSKQEKNVLDEAKILFGG